MVRSPFHRHRGAWRRFRDRNDKRHVVPDWMDGGQIHADFYGAFALRMAYVAGFGSALYIGLGIHPIAACIALSVCFGVAAVYVWRSGVVPSLFFGRGWQTVRRAEEEDLFWLNLGVLLVGFVASVIATGWLVLDAVASVP